MDPSAHPNERDQASSSAASTVSASTGTQSIIATPRQQASFTLGPTQPAPAVTNPFSPPASVISFSSLEAIPQGRPALAHSPSSSSIYSTVPGTPGYTQMASGTQSGTQTPRREAFTSPRSRPLTVYMPSSDNIHASANASGGLKRRRPRSTMLVESNPILKPWLTTRDPYSRIAYFVTYSMILVGVACGAIRCIFGIRDVHLPQGNLCPVLDEDFLPRPDDGPQGVDGRIFGDNGVFFREVDMSGFGNGEFEMTTNSPQNSYVKNGQLFITPTLTSEEIGETAVLSGHVYNITGCTYNITSEWGNGLNGVNKTASLATPDRPPTEDEATAAERAYLKACSAVSNSTNDHTSIINPIQTARLSTRRSASIRYGRVEVRAKISTGDWFWPAIWMLPVDNVYGAWPKSGEIDIMESRGNGPTYPGQGYNVVRTSLNWGPLLYLNAVYKTYGWWSKKRGGYNDGFHNYVLEWDEGYMRVYVDARLTAMLNLKIDQSFWNRGDFPAVIQEGGQSFPLENPWVNGTNAAPFDQSFYLILSLAVGGTNGWFPDNLGKKPWFNRSLTAMLDFWNNREDWLKTWPQNIEDRALVVDSVKMWQQC